MEFWLPVLLIAVGTFFIRFSFIGGRMKFVMPEMVRRGLDFVPVSVMAALVALGFFVDDQKTFVLYGPSLAAAGMASLLAWKFGRDVLTIAAGLAVYWLAEFLLI
ncbi:branched-chain amino acid ABC transporter [Deltaproteobacteria bacterium Smac51]|nr:branched-chain amino acid ABC transporter [Deltaproteobacteria bacterium Smac51]